MKPSVKVAQLTDLIRPAVQACDVSLWGIEFTPQGKRSLLRIYIESLPEAKAQGEQVSIEDCAAVNHQVSGILEVHDPIAGEYVLEVSSPGFDRPFFNTEQMQAHLGDVVFVRLIEPIQDESGKRRKLNGKLDHVADDHIVVLLEGGSSVRVPVGNIDRAQLQA